MPKPKINQKNTLSRVFILLVLAVAIVAYYFMLANKAGDVSRLSGNSSYDDYRVFEQALNFAGTDIDRALSLCIESGKMENECLNKVAVVVSEKSVERGFSICEGISNLPWKGECFFAIAETLFNKNVSMAIESCEKAGIMRNGCYTNMGRFIICIANDENFAISACKSVPEAVKSTCFTSIGNTACNSRSMRDIISTCSNTPIEFRGYCFRGIGWSIGSSFGRGADFAVSSCDKVPAEFRGECLDGMASTIYLSFGGDIDSAISACNKVPVGYRPSCLSSLSFGAGYRGNTFSCSQFEKPYNFICILSLGKEISKEFLDESEKCSTIKDEDLKRWCYRGFGRGLSDQYSNNISSALDICGSLSEENRFDCSKGVAEGVVDSFSGGNLYTILNRCKGLSMFNSYCYERVGKKATELYSYNLSKAFDICNNANDSLRNSCFVGIGRGLGEQFLYNPSLASIKCESLPNPYNVDCKQGLNEIIKFYNVSL